MICTACLVCLVSTVSGCCENTLGRGSTSSGHITKLEQSTFLRYLWSSSTTTELEKKIFTNFECLLKKRSLMQMFQTFKWNFDVVNFGLFDRSNVQAHFQKMGFFILLVTLQLIVGKTFPKRFIQTPLALFTTLHIFVTYKLAQ